MSIAKDLSDDLTAWRQASQEQSDTKEEEAWPAARRSQEAFPFPNRDGFFMDRSNYSKRDLHKLARELCLPKLTFKVI